MPRSGRRYDLLRKQLDLFTRTLPGVEQGDVRALHRARVASRRLRELIPVLPLDDETAAKLSKRLRKVTTRLGGVRELDVLRQLAGELERNHPRRLVDLVRAAIERERSERREALASDHAVDDLRRVAAKLRNLLDALEEQHDDGRRPANAWTWAIDARLARRAAKLRAAIDAAGTVYAPERLHDVRIALKKLRYALELGAAARGVKTTPELVALRRAQDLLGRLHDLQLLAVRARRIGEAAGQRGAARDLDSLLDALEADCRQLHAQYVGERASILAVCDRALSTRRAARAAHVRRTA